jgi:hypothetical protein
VDGVDVELQLAPTPLSPGSPLDALLGRVGKERQGHHMVAKSLHPVGQRQICVEAVTVERETLESFHGKEEPGKTFQEILPFWRANVIVFRHRYCWSHPFRDSEWKSLKSLWW